MINFAIENFNAVKFFPYAHIVKGVIATNEPYNRGSNNPYPDESDQLMEKLWKDAVEKAKKADIGYRHDNKSVIKLQSQEYPDRCFYIGRYDHRISIGLGIKDSLNWINVE